MKIVLFICMFVTLSNAGHPNVIAMDNPAVDCYTQEGYVAAISKEYLEDVIRYSIDKDYVAINKLLDTGVIIKMKKGVKVHLVETHLFSGTVEFRVHGYTDILWTVTEGIKC
jgi:hypothetical protein